MVSHTILVPIVEYNKLVEERAFFRLKFEELEKIHSQCKQPIVDYNRSLEKKTVTPSNSVRSFMGNSNDEWDSSSACAYPKSKKFKLNSGNGVKFSAKSSQESECDSFQRDSRDSSSRIVIVKNCNVLGFNPPPFNPDSNYSDQIPSYSVAFNLPAFFNQPLYATHQFPIGCNNPRFNRVKTAFFEITRNFDIVPSQQRKYGYMTNLQQRIAYKYKTWYQKIGQSEAEATTKALLQAFSLALRNVRSYTDKNLASALDDGRSTLQKMTGGGFSPAKKLVSSTNFQHQTTTPTIVQQKPTSNQNIALESANPEGNSEKSDDSTDIDVVDKSADDDNGNKVFENGELVLDFSDS